MSTTRRIGHIESYGFHIYDRPFLIVMQLPLAFDIYYFFLPLIFTTIRTPRQTYWMICKSLKMKDFVQTPGINVYCQSGDASVLLSCVHLLFCGTCQSVYDILLFILQLLSVKLLVCEHISVSWVGLVGVITGLWEEWGCGRSGALGGVGLSEVPPVHISLSNIAAQSHCHWQCDCGNQ